MIISIYDCCSNFAENKDSAKKIRNELLIPTYNNTNENIIIDFNEVDSSTQSFIHALISDLFQKHGENVLTRIEFKNCNEAIKSLITTVINYSME
jgi:hypothetical protein